MPAGRGNDAERFAAALEEGRSPGYGADAELSHELEIVAMLRASGSAYAPAPDAKARARARVLAALAAQNGAAEHAPTAMEMTLPISDSRLAPTPRNRADALRDQETAAEITSRIAPISDEYDAGFEAEYDEYEADEIAAAAHAEADDEPVSTAHSPVRTRSGRRTGRHKMPSRPASVDGSSRPRRHARSGLRRVAVTASFALLALVVAAGGGMFASRDALPGDTLYGVKRVAESAGTALTFDDAARAARHLELASTRLNEVEQLVDDKGTEQADPTLLSGAILDFDSSTGEGSDLILTEDEAHDPARLADLQAWAAEQVSRLSTLRSGLPTSAQTEVDHSIELLDKLRQRAAELEDRAPCEDVTSGRSDDVGPIPATSDCEPAVSDDDDDTSSPARPSRKGGAPSSDADPSDSPSTTPDGLLPGLLDGSTSPSASSDDEDSTDSTSSVPPTSSSAITVPLPLPLLPPINLPPLLPGGRGITIGG